MSAKKIQPMVRKSSINDARIAGLYDLEHTIGKGHFAVVKLARHCFTGEKVAVKVIDKMKLDPISQAHMMQEVRCMKLVQHPNIVRLYEVIDTSTKLFLILELGDYDMYEYIMKNEHKGIKESEAQQYFSQIIKAIDYCHALHVVHRDLKPENVVFFEKLGMVKLTDFGFSNLFTPGQQLSTACGSMAYSAPEILLGDAYDAPAVDVWSLGVILYMLVCARLPFQETNESETLTKILDCKYTIPDHVSQSCKTLIARMLVRDPVNRANLIEITQSSWVVAGDRGHAEVLPLIAKDHLPENAHATIIDQMVAGGIASEEQVVSAIDNDDYNYITATYYLLAERVLASYRELQASRLIPTSSDASGVFVDDTVIVECEPSTSTPTTSVGFRSRSRSNSWRGSTSRRACTILKEESEEELSTYLRSPSRQSSRAFSVVKESFAHSASSRASRSSRTSSLERDFGGTATSNGLVADAVARLLAPASKELTSIRELGEQQPVFGLPEADEDGSDERPNSLQLDSSSAVPRRRPPRIMRHSISLDGCPEDDAEALDDRPASSQRAVSPTAALPRTPSAPSTFFSSMARKRLFRPSLLRRNSSPSVSMFAGTSGLHSSRDRISPQAIQDLLEFSRLSGGMRRAASPESRISSRSPSPCSSGRTSPAITGSFIRLKVSAGPSVTTGMRKLSSSPHLLGICEESEDSPDTSTLNLAPSMRSVSTISAPKTPHISRGNRSASVGLGSLPISFLPLKDSKEKAFKPTGPPLSPSAKTHPASATNSTPSYSAMRVIRPRQAVVSPDMVRRYESHQRLVSRTRRSTSCSSSETSDDDTNERKLSLIGTRYCRRGPDDRFNDDDTFGGGGGGSNGGGGGGQAGPRRSNSMKEQTIIEEPSNATAGSGDATAVAHGAIHPRYYDGYLTPESPSSLSLYSESDASVYGKIPGTPLPPILEDETGGKSLFSQSEALMDWVQESQSYCLDTVNEDSTSPDSVKLVDLPSTPTEFYRTLRRSKSLDDPALPFTKLKQQDCDSLNLSTSSCNLTPAEEPKNFDEGATDSGCSSDDECRRVSHGKDDKITRPISWFTELTNRVFHEIHRRTGISPV